MLAEIAPFQWLLNAIGWILAEIYRFLPNYGVAIIVLTLLIRFVLFPLGMKQIKSMQAMQAIQPKVKEIQKKYKNDKAKAQEAQMKLYKDAGVNPLGGCLPLLLQFPILISMYAVIKTPQLEPIQRDGTTAYVVQNNHLPTDSTLFQNVVMHRDTQLLIMNLQCSAAQSGTTPVLNDMGNKSANQESSAIQADRPLYNGRTYTGSPTDQPIPGVRSQSTLDCGSGIPAKIPYFSLLALMIATTFYQQRQMQKASPPGAASQQQQAIMRFMPLMFGIFGLAFPAGLVLYWTVSNLFQIGQQALLLRAGHIGPDALERRMAEQRERAGAKADKKPGFMARIMAAQADAQAQRERQARSARAPESGRPKTNPQKGPNPGRGGGGSPRRRPNTGGTGGKRAGDQPKKRPGSGESGGS